MIPYYGLVSWGVALVLDFHQTQASNLDLHKMLGKSKRFPNGDLQWYNPLKNHHQQQIQDTTLYWNIIIHILNSVL